MLLQDLPRQAEANARAGFFGGIKRNENLLQGFGLDAATVVLHLNDDLVGGGEGAQLNKRRRLPRKYLQGILDEVDKYL